MIAKRSWVVHTIGLAFAGTAVVGCTDDPAPPGPAPTELVADSAPLTRMTAEQYNNTVRDLFAPLDVGQVVFPVELRGRGGFENDVTLNTATPALVETYQRAAAQVSERVIAGLDTVLGCDRTDPACGRTFVTELAERAWRRPLTAEEQGALLADYDAWSTQHGLDTAMALTIQLLLQSPDFLYFPRFGLDTPAPGDGVPLTDWELASRLSYLLWNSMPDAELLDLARQGRLQDRQVLADQALRMLSDGRAVDMVVSFHRQSWDFDEVGANPIDLDFYAPVFEARGLVAEDDKSDYYYLEYSPQVRFESDVFIARHVFHGEGRLRTLLTSNQAWVTPDVAELAYQQTVDENLEPILWVDRVPQEGNDEWGIYEGDYFPITLDPAQRAGLFTMAGFLIAKAGPQQPAPVRRGVTVLSRLMCTETPPPPGDVPPLEQVEGTTPQTNRDKYAIHSQSAACAGCHEPIDGIGLTFEHYDSMGRWRDTDNGYPVDASGQLLGTDQDGEVTDAVALMQRLGRSRAIHDCYVRQWFRYAFGRNETPHDAPTLETLQQGFWDSDGDILELVVNLAGSYSFRHRRAP